MTTTSKGTQVIISFSPFPGVTAPASLTHGLLTPVLGPEIVPSTIPRAGVVYAIVQILPPHPRTEWMVKVVRRATQTTEPACGDLGVLAQV